MTNTDSTQPAGDRKRILVMDDEDVVRLIIGMMLDELGFEAVAAENGEEAIEKYRAAYEEGKPIAAALLDIKVMGGMGGEECVRKLLELDPGVKAIVSSGYAELPVMTKYAEYGFSGVMRKPYRLEELKKVLDDVLGV